MTQKTAADKTNAKATVAWQSAGFETGAKAPKTRIAKITEQRSMAEHFHGGF